MGGEACRIVNAHQNLIMSCWENGIVGGASSGRSTKVVGNKGTYKEKNSIETIHILLVWLLDLYVLATSKVISGWVPTYDSAQLYCAAPPGHQVTGIMTQYRHTELICPCPIRLIPSATLGGDKYQFYKSVVWFACKPNSQSHHSMTKLHWIGHCIGL